MSAKTANLVPAPHTVAVVVYDGVDQLGLAIAWEVFGTDHGIGAEPPWYRLLICGSGPVRVGQRPAHGSDRRAGPVGGRRHRLVPACEAADGPSEAVLQALRQAHARGARLVSLCTGTFVLAAAGLLDGRRVTTHWAECAELAARHPELTVDPGVLYVDDGDILTSAGSAAGIDLCLHLVRADRGAEAATRVARELVVPPYRDGGQAQYIDTPLPELDRGRPVRRHHRLGAAAPGRAGHGGRSGAALGDEPAHVRPPVRREHRHHAVPVAAAAAAAARATPARDHRPADRRGGPAQRPGHRGQPAQALHPRGAHHARTAYRSAFRARVG